MKKALLIVFIIISCLITHAQNWESKYNTVYPFSENFAPVKLNGKWGFVDANGKEVISCKYDDVIRFSESLAGVKTNGKWGFINKAGKEVVSCKYDEVMIFSEGFAVKIK